jgi:hypothetical protein
MSVVPQTDTDVRERARRLYDEFVAPKLTEADAEKYVSLDLRTGAFEIDADMDAAVDRAAARFGGENLYTVKAGFRPTASLRVRPFKSGEKEWLLAKLTRTAT